MGAKQVFKVLRAPLSNLPTLLAKSGKAGVFVLPPAGQRKKVVVKRVDCHSKKSDKNYLRASRVEGASQIELIEGSLRGLEKDLKHSSRIL